MTSATRLARIFTVSAIALSASTLTVDAASAASPQKCNSYFCNETVGEGNYVQYVNAGRKSALTNVYGFFEVFGPGGKIIITGPSSTHGEQLPISRSFPSNSKICLRFFANVDGHWIERGAAVCNVTPLS